MTHMASGIVSKHSDDVYNDKINQCAIFRCNTTTCRHMEHIFILRLHTNIKITN